MNDNSNNHLNLNDNDNDNDNLTLFTKYTGVNTTLLASILISKDAILLSISQSQPISYSVQQINTLFTYYNVPNKSLLTNDELTVGLLTVIITLVVYYGIIGKYNRRKRKMLVMNLQIMKDKVSSIILVVE